MHPTCYGKPGSANQGRFQYTGQMWLAEAGLYHYKARIYDPGLGRFLQTDPIGYADGLNLYAYVGGDPVNATDPSGLLERGFSLFGGSCSRECIDSLGGGGDEVVVEGTRGEFPCLACGNPAPGLFDGAGFPRGFGGTQLGGESGAGGRFASCPDPNGCITVMATRTTVDTNSFFATPIPDSSYYRYYGFKPGDFCFENPNCSGRAEAVYFDIEAIVAIAGVRSLQLAPALLTELGLYLGPAGPVFGQSILGAPRAGVLNKGFVRIGFTGYGNRAVFRIGIGQQHIPIFSVPRG